MEISAFLEYICNQKTVDDFTLKIDSFVQKIKQQEVNRKEYSSVNIHDQDNYLRGKKEGAIETAKNMLLASLGTIEQIAKITNLPLQTIKDLANNLTPQS